MPADKQYLNLVKRILSSGSHRLDRTKTGTRSLFGEQLKFNIENTIPLLTTKKVAYNTICKELLWFLKGHTNSKILERDNVHIWKGNTSLEFLRKRGLSYAEGDLGPMYFFNILHYGATYEGAMADYTGKGINQLDEVMELLLTDPWSRRILMTTYNVANRHQGVLFPCHGLVIQFHVDEAYVEHFRDPLDETFDYFHPQITKQQYLSCHCYQRSADVFLGLPFNIASYGILTHIIAKKTNMIPRELIISLGDAHIYNNHLHQLETQLNRTPFPPPQFHVADSVKTTGFHEITMDQFKLTDYQCHSALRAPMSV
jgi:thymidylate synthase